MSVEATCPNLDKLARLVRRHIRTQPDRRHALDLIEWQRGAHMELRRLAVEHIAVEHGLERLPSSD